MYTIARILDDSFEGEHMVLGTSLEHVSGIVAAYLRACRPERAASGSHLDLQPLEVPEERPEGGWYAWLADCLMDLSGIDVELWSTENGTLDQAGTFRLWVVANAAALRRQHARGRVEDVTVQGEAL